LFRHLYPIPALPHFFVGQPYVQHMIGGEPYLHGSPQLLHGHSQVPGGLSHMPGRRPFPHVLRGSNTVRWGHRPAIDPVIIGRAAHEAMKRSN
jgi:hypothetical protein